MSAKNDVPPVLERMRERVLQERQGVFLQNAAALYREHVDADDDEPEQAAALADAIMDYLDGADELYELPKGEELTAAAWVVIQHDASVDELRELVSEYLVQHLPRAKCLEMIGEQLKRIPKYRKVDLLEQLDSDASAVGEKYWFLTHSGYNNHRADVDAYAKDYIAKRRKAGR